MKTIIGSNEILDRLKRFMKEGEVSLRSASMDCPCNNIATLTVTITVTEELLKALGEEDLL